MTAVYVLSKNGKPLMPTTRCGHVRWLLKNKKARVVERVPFTIRLSYDTEEITQDLYMGIDPGRTNIGVSVCRDNGVEVFREADMDVSRRRLLHTELVFAVAILLDPARFVELRLQVLQADGDKRRPVNQRRAGFPLIFLQVGEDFF